jgi:hypothetical protein
VVSIGSTRVRTIAQYNLFGASRQPNSAIVVEAIPAAACSRANRCNPANLVDARFARQLPIVWRAATPLLLVSEIKQGDHRQNADYEHQAVYEYRGHGVHLRMTKACLKYISNC